MPSNPEMEDIQLKPDLIYQAISEGYRAIDDFRASLLTLLLLASGGGIFLLL